MKKSITLVLTFIFAAYSAIFPVFAIVPGEDTAPASFSYGQLQEMYLDYLSDQQISLAVGTPAYYQYAQTQIYDNTNPVLKSHPFYSQIRSYLIEYSALYQDYLYANSALQKDVATGEQLIAQFSADNPCLQYSFSAKKLTFTLSDSFLNKTLAQSKAENEVRYALSDQFLAQNTSTTASANYTYNPSNAISYARQYAIHYNASYPDLRLNGGDCTNFASQCLYAGGIPMVGSNNTTGTHASTTQWYCQITGTDIGNLHTFSRSTSWVRVTDFSTYMRGRAVQWRIVGTLDELVAQCQPGDIIQLMEKNGGRIYHSTIITSKNASTACYCAHSDPRLDASVRTHFDETVDSFVILSFRALPSSSGVSLDTCEPCDDQIPSTTSVEFQNASLDRVVECPNHNGAHDAEKYIYTYNIVCTRHGTVVGTKSQTVYICLPE